MNIDAFSQLLFDLAVPHEPAPLGMTPSPGVPERGAAPRGEHRAHGTTSPHGSATSAEGHTLDS